MRLFLCVLLASFAYSTVLLARGLRGLPAGKPFEYRGWKNCYRLANASVEVIITPDAGARIIYFAFHRRRNVLLVDPKADGKVIRGDQSWLPWDGSAPDTLSPDGGSQLAHLWLGRYEVSDAGPLHLKCRSSPNRKAGIRMTKEFSLAAGAPRLTIKRTLHNISGHRKKWSFWERTLVPGDAVAFGPVNPRSRCGSLGWAIRDRSGYRPAAKPGTNPQNLGGILVVKAQGKGTNVGIDAAEGWTAASVHGSFFCILFPVYPMQQYPWGSNISCVFFFASDRIELEPLTPYFEIEPGGART